MEDKNTVDKVHDWLSGVVNDSRTRKETKPRQSLEDRFNNYGKDMSVDSGLRLGIIATIVVLIIAIISSIRTISLFIN